MLIRTSNPIPPGYLRKIALPAPFYPKKEQIMSKWNEDRVETLKTMWENGESASKIAETLGNTTRNSVIGKAHRMGLKRPAQDKAE